MNELIAIHMWKTVIRTFFWPNAGLTKHQRKASGITSDEKDKFKYENKMQINLLGSAADNMALDWEIRS